MGEKAIFKDIFTDLIVPELSTEELRERIIALHREFEQYKKESVKWDIEDFFYRAKERNLVITPEKAQEALERMIYKHDANLGICWVTIDYYLDKYCEPKNEEEKDNEKYEKSTD